MPEPNDLNPLAAALRDLAPSTGGLNRDRLLFDAGRAAALPACSWAWPVTAAGFALLSIVFAGVLAFNEPRILVVERERPVMVEGPAAPVELPRPEESPPSPEPSPTAVVVHPTEDAYSADTRRMVELRRDMLRWGVEMLPVPRGATAPARRPRDRELEQILRPTPGAFASPYLLPFRPPICWGGDD